MPDGKIISIHSYRGGTGKSNMTANIAACATRAGKRVAVLDTDLQSPGIHVLFGYDHEKINLTLVDFLWGKCDIVDTVYDVTSQICPNGDAGAGKCWLVPASLTTQAISRILDEGYDVQRLNTHFDALMDEFDLDILLIDTHPGLNRETMLTTAISDVLVLLIRPDQQDYYGSAVLIEVANKLELPHVFLIANKVFSGINEAQLRERLQTAFGYDVIGMIPLSEDLAMTGSKELFSQARPDHPITHEMQAITKRLMEC
jgi:septum site-determining protein MinD